MDRREIERFLNAVRQARVSRERAAIATIVRVNDLAGFVRLSRILRVRS